MKPYPLKDASKWRDDPQYNDGKLTWMSPDAFLSRVPALTGTVNDKKQIKKHISKIENGKKLKPLAIYADGAPNGRHRAVAARELGVKRVPVLLGGKAPMKYPGKLAVKGRK